MQDEHIGPVMLRVLAMLVLTPIYAAILKQSVYLCSSRS
jgi:hypothetical protein